MQWYSSPNLQNQTKDSNDKFSTKPNIFSKPKIQNTCNSFFFLPLQCLFQNKIKSKKKTKLQTAISEQSLAPYLRCNVQVKKDRSWLQLIIHVCKQQFSSQTHALKDKNSLSASQHMGVIHVF